MNFRIYNENGHQQTILLDDHQPYIHSEPAYMKKKTKKDKEKIKIARMPNKLSEYQQSK